jgi:hypothetical protein
MTQPTQPPFSRNQGNTCNNDFRESNMKNVEMSRHAGIQELEVIGSDIEKECELQIKAQKPQFSFKEVLEGTRELTNKIIKNA